MPASDVLDKRDAAHLLRHAGFGGSDRDVKRLAGRTRADAVAKLVGKKPSKARGPVGKGKDHNKDFNKLKGWWLKRMISRSRGVQEKLVLFWHDHFPSPSSSSGGLRFVAAQNAVFRRFGMGPLPELLHRVTRDGAMLRFLDGLDNKLGVPNENYARELMELFCLGPKDFNGVDNYTQDDVVDMARAVTGYRWEDTETKKKIILAKARHDPDDKTLFAGTAFEATGPLGVESPDGTVHPPEQNVLEILLTHRDSDARPTAARFLARKLWEWFACPDPPLWVVDELADTFVDSGYVLKDLLVAILTHDHFYAEECRNAQVKSPVDFALQSLKRLGVRTSFKAMPDILEDMGLELFNPPGVEGWTHGPAWLASSRLLARFDFAQAVADGHDPKNWRFKPKKLFPKHAADTGVIVDGLLDRLEVQVPETTRQILVLYLNSGPNLDDDTWFETKFRGLFVLLLTLPEFQVH